MHRVTRYGSAGLLALLIAGLGVHLMTDSHAATVSASVEAEGGTTSGLASVVSDATASNAKAVLFGATQTDIPTIDSAVASFMSQYSLPGVSIAITHQEKLVYVKSYGTNGGTDNSAVTNASRYRIASVSKPITSTGIYKLIEAGKLSLDSTVFGSGGILGSDYPAAPAVDNTITIRNLLQHTTGVWANDANDPVFQHPEMTQQQLITWTLSTYPANTNRGNYAYSNFGYVLLGRVIEKLTGETYEKYIQDNVLAPMGITDMQIGGSSLSARLPNEVEYVGQGGQDPYASNIILSRIDANGGWIASATDLAKFLVHSDGFSNVPDFLKASSITTMTTPSTANPNYASGWQVNSASNWWHLGSLPGTESEIVRAANGFNWVILTNSRSTSANFDSATDNLLWPIINGNTTWQDIDQFN